jgi:hypothetical protein
MFMLHATPKRFNGLLEEKYTAHDNSGKKKLVFHNKFDLSFIVFFQRVLQSYPAIS